MEEIGLDNLKQTYHLWIDNLLRNPNMDQGLEINTEERLEPNYEGWNIPNVRYGDRGTFKVEHHFGSDPWPKEAGVARHNVVTTYYTGRRSQTICLVESVPTILGLLREGRRVQVYWSVWIAPRFDCGSHFTASISWGEDKRVELENVKLDAGTEWRKLEKVVTLDGCLDGVFVYSETGIDRKYWLGYYGVKVLNPELNVRIV
eukprot:sb/3470580/